MRKRDEDHLWFLQSGAVVVVEPVQKLSRSGHRERTGVSLGHQNAVLVDRISGVGRDHLVARTNDGEQKMREGVLGADCDNRFGLGVQFDTVPLLVPLYNLEAKVWDTAGNGIPVVPGALYGFDEL